MRILLVYPQNPDTFWSFKHVLRFVSKRSTFPPLGLLTIAAMLPADWQLKLVDLNVERLKDSDLRWADYVMISAMIIHKQSVQEIVARCAAFKKPVIAGRPALHHWPRGLSGDSAFCAGRGRGHYAATGGRHARGHLQPHYRAADRPDITRVPAPRWDLINFRHYVTMAVQFSRGCPYDCEFCDIIIMNGRVPRTKTPAQLIAELEALRRQGWKDMVFIVDDNFIGDKNRTKALLRELIAWRERVKPEMGFFTEASSTWPTIRSLRADGEGRLQEGLCRHRDAVG